MEDPGKQPLAPLASLSIVAPSLETSPSKTPHNNDIAIPIENEKTEVTFKSGTSSSSSSCSVEEEEEEEEEELKEVDKPKIPDGGWGWVVVFASLVASMIADGISFSFGLLYEEFKDEFESSSSETSWIGSLFVSVPLITGPVMSALVDKYGCRSMTILGGLVSALGFVLSWKVTHIGVMYLTFGVLSGLGLGLCYVTVVVSIAFWFDKKRTLAVGLSAAGTGIGTFVFSPLTTYLLFEFHWRGTTLILAGVLLNLCVCGALMIDPDWIIEQNKGNSKLSKSGKSSKTSLESVSSTNVASCIDINELKKLLQSGKNAEYFLQTLETSMKNEASPDDKAVLKNVHNSVLNLPTYIKQNEKVPFEVLEQLSTNRKLYNIILENYPSLLLCRSTSDKGVNKLEEDPSRVQRVPVTFSLKLKKEDKPKMLTHKDSLPEEHITALEPLMNDKKPASSNMTPPRNSSIPWLKQHLLQKQNYLRNLRFHWQSSMVHRGAIINANKYRFRASSCPNIYRVSMVTLPEKDEKWYTEMVDVVKGVLDFSLFLELHFFLMSLSTIILFVWFIVPYFYLGELMKKAGYDKERDVPFTIANIGITNTIGMIVLGWAGDQSWMNITKSYAICLVLCGATCAGMFYFVKSFIMLEVCAGLFGLFLSSSFSFTPGILVELVPLERFTVAYGLQLLCMGIGLLVGPPYAAHLYDVTGTWEQTFYQGAIWIVVSGILVALIPYTKNRKITGDGPVEKEVEGGANRMIHLIIFIPALIASVLLVMYYTIITLV